MLALFCRAVVTQRPLIVETHSYPAVPSDDQPDRSAAHKNLGTWKHNGQAIHKHYRASAAWSRDHYATCSRAAGTVWGATAKVCLASDWLQGRAMLARMLLHNSGCTRSIPTWNYEPESFKR